jgi:hypothetical protein
VVPDRGCRSSTGRRRHRHRPRRLVHAMSASAVSARDSPLLTTVDFCRWRSGHSTSWLLGFAKCSLVRDAGDSWSALQRVSVTPARIHITCDAKSFRFDLTLHDTPDLVVRGWLLGVTDADGQLSRTDFLAADATPGDVYRWLQPVTGPDIALQLVRGARQALEQDASAERVPTLLDHDDRFAGSGQPVEDGRSGPGPGCARGGRLIAT